MIDGYAYALVIDGAEVRPWITGEDGTFRDVNLVRAIGRHERQTGDLVRSAQVVDQRSSRLKLQYPTLGFATDGERVFHA